MNYSRNREPGYADWLCLCVHLVWVALHATDCSWVRACVRACVGLCVRVCVCVCACAFSLSCFDATGRSCVPTFSTESTELRNTTNGSPNMSKSENIHQQKTETNVCFNVPIGCLAHALSKQVNLVIGSVPCWNEPVSSILTPFGFKCHEIAYSHMSGEITKTWVHMVNHWLNITVIMYVAV